MQAGIEPLLGRENGKLDEESDLSWYSRESEFLREKGGRGPRSSR
jgi:hypothetical protein